MAERGASGKLRTTLETLWRCNGWRELWEGQRADDDAETQGGGSAALRERSSLRNSLTEEPPQTDNDSTSTLHAIKLE